MTLPTHSGRDFKSAPSWWGRYSTRISALCETGRFFWYHCHSKTPILRQVRARGVSVAKNFATTSDQYAHDGGGDTIKLFSTWDRVVVMCWLSAYMRTGRAMTMFYAGTPITCIWCDKSRYMTSHVVLVVITTFWIWPLPGILRQVRARSIEIIGWRMLLVIWRPIALTVRRKTSR